MNTFLAACACAVMVLSGLLPGAAAEPPITIPVILPLTGGNAFAGNGQRTAFALLQTLVNRGGGIHGRSIVFDVHDSGSNSQVAVQLGSREKRLVHRVGRRSA